MKLFPVALGVSMATNIALIAFVVVGATGDAVTPIKSAVVAPATKSADRRAADAMPGADTWATLHTGELHAELERLRAEDFPPAIIRAIISAQIRQGFAARRKAIESAMDEQPYWRNPMPDPKAQAAFRELYKEEQKAIKDILGPDPDSGPIASLHRQFPNLPDDKIEQLAGIRERYDQQRQDLYASVGTAMLPDEREKLEALDKAQRAEFASTLSPAEFEDYELRTNRTSNQLRNNLSALDVTEQEFRALYKLQSAFDEKFSPMYSAPSEEQMKLRSEAQKQLALDIKTALGDERYADYQRATNSNFRQTSQLVARLELPPETATQIYSVQQDIQKRANALRQDRTLSPDDRVTQLTALASEAQVKISGSLGATGFDAYKQYGGQWLQNLVPKPSSPPSKD
jgi:hypothetical protein